jgi:hypothetical protein
MKYLLTLIAFAMVAPAANAQRIHADYSDSVDLAVRYLDDSRQCLAGVEAAIVYFHGRPDLSVLRLRNFIQGDVCARPGGNLLKANGFPLRSYQHSSAWRYYQVQFDGADSCNVLHFSGTTTYQKEVLRFTLQDYRGNKCRQVVPPAKVVLTEYQSQDYFNRYFYYTDTPEEAHFQIFD